MSGLLWGLAGSLVLLSVLLLYSLVALQRTLQQLSAQPHHWQHLQDHMEKQMQWGLGHTTEQLQKVLGRLSSLDHTHHAMQSVSERISHLHHLLDNRAARGVWGEVQLRTVIQDMFPGSHYQMQHTLPNGKRADCALFLPAPTGTVLIDAKFPFEAYRRMQSTQASPADKRQFAQDVRKHIRDVADKYIIPGVTSDGAILFIPAESVFVELHNHFPDVIAEAMALRVWVASPTTLIAILTTARGVLQDAALHAQTDHIKQELGQLSKDFRLFFKRLHVLFRHVQQAQQAVHDASVSAGKIQKRFQHISSGACSGEETDPP